MTVEPTTDPVPAKPRRDVLCGLVVALLAPGALAAACSDDSGGGGTTPTGGGAPTGGGSPTGGGAPTGGGGGQTLAALADVPEGSGLVVDNPSGGKLLLVRPSGDEVKGYNASCPHQGSTINPPRGDTITCPNHGSQFDTATGSVKRGPAESGLVQVAVAVEGTNVVLA